MTCQLSVLKQLILQKAVMRGNFILASGASSNYYIDCRKASLCYDGILLIGNLIAKHIKNELPITTVVCGPESAGIPLVAAVVIASRNHYMHIDGSYVRKAAKDHGTQSLIEGKTIDDSDIVLIVDDVATSGTSLLTSINAVRNTGAKVIGVVTVIDRLCGAESKIQEMGIPYKALLTINDLGL